MSRAVAVAATMLVLIDAGCGQRFIDGIPVGGHVDNDAQFVDFAVAALDDADPGHAAVAGVDMYRPDYRTTDGQRVLLNRSGSVGDYVVVLQLADGGIRAFYVMCGAGLNPDRCFLGPPVVQ